MKYFFLIMFSANILWAATQPIHPSFKKEETIATAEGINFNEWETEFDDSMKKAKNRVRKCEAQSKNCKFERYQALDPSYETVH